MGSPSVTEYGVFFLNAFPADPMDFVVNLADPQETTDERWVFSTVAKAPGNAGGGVGLGGSSPIGAAPFTQLIVQESGTYISEDPAADFLRDQQVFVTIFDPFGFVPATPLNITFNDDGTWEAEATIDLAAATFGAGARTIQVNLSNIVSLSQTGVLNNASFTKTSARIFVPEPTVVGLLGLVAPFVVIRRRR